MHSEDKLNGFNKKRPQKLLKASLWDAQGLLNVFFNVAPKMEEYEKTGP